MIHTTVKPIMQLPSCIPYSVCVKVSVEQHWFTEPINASLWSFYKVPARGKLQTSEQLTVIPHHWRTHCPVPWPHSIQQIGSSIGVSHLHLNSCGNLTTFITHAGVFRWRSVYLQHLLLSMWTSTFWLRASPYFVSTNKQSPDYQRLDLKHGNVLPPLSSTVLSHHCTQAHHLNKNKP